MAIIKIGAPLTGIRGTIGGITYSENKSGTYAKAWGMPTNPNSPKQTTERAFVAQLSASWRAMSDAQRTAWDTFAALPAQELTNSLGEAYYASGWNWYVKCNVRLLRLGRATIVPVPTQARPAAPTIDEFRVCVGGSESDLCIGGAATAGSVLAGYEATKAFDNLLTNESRWQTANGITASWLRYDLTATANVKHYRIYTFDHTSTTNAKNWVFNVYANAMWNPIHTVTNWAPATSGWHDFYCPNEFTSTMYHINITANAGHASALCIWEMEYLLGDVESSVICYPEDEFAGAPDYDLVLHISLGQTTGKTVQYPGYYETLVTQTPGRWFALFQDEIEAVFGSVSMNKSWFARLYRQTSEGIRSAPSAERAITIGG